MTDWRPLLFGTLASAPWWVRALLSEKYQKKYDNFFKFLNPDKVRWFAIICIVLSFVWANYQVWRDEHTNVIRITSELTNEKDINMPKFHVEIASPITFYDATKDRTFLLPILRISNRGAPSAVMSWRAHYSSRTINKDIKYTILIGPVVLEYPGKQTLIFDQKDSIANIKEPIGRGSYIVGRLPFIIPGKIEDDQATLSITVTDIMGHKSTATTIMKITSEPTFYPGENVKQH